jgi:hypothetical protein
MLRATKRKTQPVPGAVRAVTFCAAGSPMVLAGMP